MSCPAPPQFAALVRLIAYAIQPIADRFFDALRDHQFANFTTFPPAAFTAYRTLFNQRLQNLFDKERVAFSFAMDGFTKFGADVLAQKRAQLLVRFLDPETTQGDAGDQPFAVPVHQRARQGMRPVEFSFAIAANNQRPLFAQLTQR